MGMRSEEYKDFSLRVHLKGTRKPIVGQFELTHRCNLKCQHCYVMPSVINKGRGAREDRRGTRDDGRQTKGEGRGTMDERRGMWGEGRQTKGEGRKELTYEELWRILDEVYHEGCLWLCLTGGEPLLREDFLDIYSYAYKKGFIITVFTNATLLDEEIAKYLNRFPPFCIELTLNGVTKKTYELITQTPSSFEKAMRGIELIRNYNLPLKLKCQAMTLNFDELPLMRRFYQEMGMRFRCSTLIDPRMDGSTEPCSLRLPIEKISELEGRKEVVKGRDEIEDDFTPLDSKHLTGFEEEPLAEQEDEVLPPSDDLFRCPGGTWAFYVNPFGELFFCNSVRKPSWDLRKHSFRQGFYELFPKIRSRKFKTDSECRTCSLWHLCLRCPGKAELECGDAEAPIPYYCELAHKQEKEVGKTLTEEN